MAILVTGAAGFIGFHVARRLLAAGESVIGIDEINAYYDPQLKRDRLAALEKLGGDFTFYRLDFADDTALEGALADHEIDGVAHLGAQPGVRYSIDHPRAYLRANLAGHLNILELARARKVHHMVYASSSSVYGERAKQPSSLTDRVDHPISLYAATKKADELMSETYAHLYRIPQTGLRFFTVYGPWGRPDMAVWKFTAAILEGRPIELYNCGDMSRDFTFIDDVAGSIVDILARPPKDDGDEKPGGSLAPHAIYNIGNNRPARLATLIELIESACGREAEKIMLPMQPGDVPATYADIDAAQRDHGYTPRTALDVGIPAFVDWYREYKGLEVVR